MNSHEAGKSELLRFLYALRNLKAASEAITHCLSHLAKEAEESSETVYVPAQDLAVLPLSGAKMTEDSLLNLTQEFETMKMSVIAAFGIPEHMLRSQEMRDAEKRMVKLADWFDDLHTVVDVLRPKDDMPTFRAQVESLLNDDRIKPFRHHT